MFLKSEMIDSINRNRDTSADLQGILQDSVQSIEQSITLDQQLLLHMLSTMLILACTSPPISLGNTDTIHQITMILIERGRKSSR